MKVVMVEHLNRKRPFWFEIEDDLAPQIEKGNTQVICDTSIGLRPGKVVSQLHNFEDVRDIMSYNGATFPLRKIAAIEMPFNTCDIIVPYCMLDSSPRIGKLFCRTAELAWNGKFNTRIAVDTNHQLVDGYTAVLIASALNMDSLPIHLVHATKPRPGRKLSI